MRMTQWFELLDKPIPCHLYVKMFFQLIN